MFIIDEFKDLGQFPCNSGSGLKSFKGFPGIQSFFIQWGKEFGEHEGKISSGPEQARKP